MTHTTVMLVYRHKHYLKACSKLLSDFEIEQCEAEIIADPTAWPIIRQSGGLRKARVRRGGKGKSGGARVIYYYFAPDNELHFLTLYAKSEDDTISKHDIALWREFITAYTNNKGM